MEYSHTVTSPMTGSPTTLALRTLTPGPHLAREVGATDEDFLHWLGGPTILNVPHPNATRTRGLSTLLHGNEPSGLRALHSGLRAGAPAKTNVIAFVGSVWAALTPPLFSHRMLPGHRDLNRCFRPPFNQIANATDAELTIAAQAISQLCNARCESLLDIHNNSGHNPSYGLGVAADPIHLALTAPFATRYVLTELRMGALMELDGPAAGCPVVTIECGRAGDPAADAVAITGLSRYFELDSLEIPGIEQLITVLIDPVRVTVKPGLKLAFGERAHAGADLTLARDVDRHNFQRLSPGTVIGWVPQGSSQASSPALPQSLPIFAHDKAERDLASALFTIHETELVLAAPRIPIMMTTDPRIAADDCLFYLCRERIT